MKRTFKGLATYVKLHDGFGKPKLNFQTLYKLFPQFTFTPDEGFGSYRNFGEAFESKSFNMIVSDGKDECFMIYREYSDTNENLAYVSQVEASRRTLK